MLREQREHHNSELDDETEVWMSADIAGDLPPYDWGEEPAPEGVSIEYDSDFGFFVLKEVAEQPLVEGDRE